MMGNINVPVEFCDGCPLACGISVADTLDYEEVRMRDTRFVFSFSDEAGDGSRTISGIDTAETWNRWDNIMLGLTGQKAIEGVRNCSQPIVDEQEVTRRRIKNLFRQTTETVRTTRCGGFKYRAGMPYVEVQSDAWQYMM